PVQRAVRSFAVAAHGVGRGQALARCGWRATIALSFQTRSSNAAHKSCQLHSSFQQEKPQMTERIFNFSAGPAVLPEPVLKKAQADLFALPGVGMSVLEISHRSAAFEQIIKEAEEDLRRLVGIPENYKVLLLQGGASLQFS